MFHWVTDLNWCVWVATPLQFVSFRKQVTQRSLSGISIDASRVGWPIRFHQGPSDSMRMNFLVSGSDATQIAATAKDWKSWFLSRWSISLNVSLRSHSGRIAITALAILVISLVVSISFLPAICA